jgi:hypothetical protein
MQKKEKGINGSNPTSAAPSAVCEGLGQRFVSPLENRRREPAACAELLDLCDEPVVYHLFGFGWFLGINQNVVVNNNLVAFVGN